jgi:hypothetical protein
MENVLGSLEAAADRFDALELWRSRGQELADAMERYERVIRRFEFGRLRFVAECSVQDVPGQEAGLSTGAFLRARLRLSPAQAHARVRSALELIGSVSISGEIVEPELPATADAASAGALSGEHVRVIGQAIRKLPPAVGARERSDAEQFLAEQSRHMDPGRVRVLAQRLHAVLDPDGSLDEDTPSRRELVFRRDVGGMDYVRGRLDAEASATVQAALGALAQPEPAQDGLPDMRSGSRHMADALVEMCGRALANGELPTVGGEKPQVTVTITLDNLRGKLSDKTLQHSGTAAADTRIPNTGTPNTGTPAAGTAGTGTPNTGTPAAGTAGTGTAGTGILNTGAAITAEAARRIACDAAVIPIVLGAQSEPLDVGRATRTIPAGIRRAVVARDIGCVHPGCAAPAAWCQAHHVKHWADGGPTSLQNLALLCHRHHRMVHHEGWQIVFLEGIPHVIPPRIVDPLQRPSRNTMHHQPGLPSG